MPTVWRVWGLFPDNTWRPVSTDFPTKARAATWAKNLNMMESRIEEEDGTD